MSELNAAHFHSSSGICPEIFSISNPGGSPQEVNYWEINYFFFFFLKQEGQIVR